MYGYRVERQREETSFSWFIPQMATNGRSSPVFKPPSRNAGLKFYFSNMQMFHRDFKDWHIGSWAIAGNSREINSIFVHVEGSTNMIAKKAKKKRQNEVRAFFCFSKCL